MTKLTKYEGKGFEAKSGWDKVPVTQKGLEGKRWPHIVRQLEVLPMYWTGQKVYLGFSVRWYGKTRTNFLANPVEGCQPTKSGTEDDAKMDKAGFFQILCWSHPEELHFLSKSPGLVGTLTGSGMRVLNEVSSTRCPIFKESCQVNTLLNKIYFLYMRQVNYKVLL